MRSVAVLLLVLGVSTSALADEGQWPPGMLKDLPAARLAEMGLKLPVQALWSSQGGLLRAVVNYGGCSGAFISKQGLVATNHHCAYGALQAASSVEHDYLKAGFVAHDSSQELPAKGRNTLWVLSRIEDVTDQVRRAAAQATDDAARVRAVDKAMLSLIQACEARQPGLRCEVESFFMGARYQLHESIEIKDVRVVFAPPSSVGEFGGEVDNWMWPRHSADFALLRAYVGPDGAPAEPHESNVPYTPPQVFEVGPQGVEPGDFVAILGYPGRTQRYLWAQALQHEQEAVLPGVIDLYGGWLELLQTAAEVDRGLAIKVAAHKKGLANRHKNALGMLAGMRRMDLVKKREAEAQAMMRWVKENKDLEGAQVLAELRKISAAAAQMFPQDLLLEHVSRGPRMLGVAIALVRRAELVDVPDEDRPPEYQQRNEARLKKRIEQAVADYNVDVETALLTTWLARAEALPAHARLKGADTVQRALKVNAARRAGALVHGNLLRDLGVVQAAFDHPKLENLRYMGDGIVKLALELRLDLQAKQQRDDNRHGALIRLAPDYLRLLQAVRKGPLYPDANGTLRVSVAQVMGYAPRDGLVAVPQTTLQGQLAKHTGEAPFNLPQPVRDAAPQASKSPFFDPKLGDLPVCFLSNGDTTGGNSGSPVIDGQGRWVGLNFDRVWENIAGDIAYNPPQSRNISVDVRYILWLLSITPGAEPLLKELGMDKVRPPAPAVATPASTAAPAPAAEKSKSSCHCVLSPAPRAGLSSVLMLGLLGWAFWRRRRG